MSYETKEIGKKIKEEIKNNRYSLEFFAEMVKTTRPTLSSWLEKDMPLSKFLEICQHLKLNPSIFFLSENNGVIQTATGTANKNINQTGGSIEIELLRQEVKHLKEKIELYEKLLKKYESD